MVHPDFIESQQRTIVTNKKSKGKTKASSCNVVSISLRETKKGVASLIDSEEEESSLFSLLIRILVPCSRHDLEKGI